MRSVKIKGYLNSAPVSLTYIYIYDIMTVYKVLYNKSFYTIERYTPNGS